MARTRQASEPTETVPSEAPKLTTGESEEASKSPTPISYDPKVYADAVEDNRQHDFVAAILEARKPPVRPEYVAPPIPAAVAAQTRLEMEMGAKRVKEAEAEEEARQAIIAARKDDKWAEKNSVEVFRPHDFVPDLKTGGQVQARQIKSE